MSPIHSGDDEGEERSGSGPELARAALEAARAQNAAKRTAAKVRASQANPKGSRTGGAGGLRRRRWSGSGPDPARDPAPLASTLKNLMKQSVSAGELAKAHVLGRWEAIVGADVASHCQPISLVDGILLVQAESTAWATQLRMLSPQLIARINGEVGSGTVTRIRAQGPTGPSWRFGPRHISGRGPRDTYG